MSESPELVDAIAEQIAAELDLQPKCVAWTLRQLDQGTSVGFIATHRRDLSGDMPPDTIRRIRDRYHRLADLERRRVTVLDVARRAGTLPLRDFEKRVALAATRRELEDLYLPLRTKSRTRAAVARGRGLAPLADVLLAQDALFEGTLADAARPFVDREKEVPDEVAALAGAAHIVAERVAEDVDTRAWIRAVTEEHGILVAELRGERAPDPLPGLVADLLGLEPPPAAPPRASPRGDSEDEMRSPGLGPPSDEFRAVTVGRLGPLSDADVPAPGPLVGPTSDDFAPEPLRDGPPVAPAPRSTLDDDPIPSADDAHDDEMWGGVRPPADASPYASLAGVRVALAAPDEALLLAINRGEHERVLQTTVEAPLELVMAYLEGRWIRGRSVFGPLVFGALRYAYERIICPIISRDVRAQAVIAAEETVIDRAREELRHVMGGPVLRGKTVLGVVPGYRWGCRLAVVGPDDRLIDHATIWPLPPVRRVDEAERTLAGLIERHGVDLVIAGVGIANRDADGFVRGFLARYHRGEVRAEGAAADAAPRRVRRMVLPLEVASDYGASKIGRSEHPRLDGPGRAAVALARRVIDPYRELAKVDPRALVTDPLAADVSPKRLREALNEVVEDLVCALGVDLNSASWTLLSYVPGIGPKLARIIADDRRRNGPFASRAELRRVPEVSEPVLHEAVSFLRVLGSPDPLDATPVHPECRDTLERLVAEPGWTIEQVVGDADRVDALDWELAADRLGARRADDLRTALRTPDPDDRPEVDLGRDASFETIRDLQVGIELSGTVTNVTDFGAFVDMGIEQDGLVHVSQLAEHYVGHPEEVVHLGQQVRVRVLNVDLDRNRVSLTMRQDTRLGPPERFAPDATSEEWARGEMPGERRPHPTGRPTRYRPGGDDGGKGRGRPGPPRSASARRAAPMPDAPPAPPPAERPESPKEPAAKPTAATALPTAPAVASAPAPATPPPEPAKTPPEPAKAPPEPAKAPPERASEEKAAPASSSPPPEKKPQKQPAPGRTEPVFKGAAEELARRLGLPGPKRGPDESKKRKK